MGGIPAGGQFAPCTHAESALDLQPSAGLPLVLDADESEDYSEYADGDVVTWLSVVRSDDGGTFNVEASNLLNLKDIIPAQDLRTNAAGHDEWLDANSAVIEDFFRRRCNAGTDTDDWEDVRAECSISADSITEAQAADEGCNRSGIVSCTTDPTTEPSAQILAANAIGAGLQAARRLMATLSTHGLWQRRYRLVPAPVSS